jgi:hypothetical protein
MDGSAYILTQPGKIAGGVRRRRRGAKESAASESAARPVTVSAASEVLKLFFAP